jgi:hypothetical protein
MGSWHSCCMLWMLLLLCIVNVTMAFFGRRVVGFSGFEISPFAIGYLVTNGSSVLLPGFLLPLSYAIVDVRDLTYLWITLPATVLIGYLALIMPNLYFLVIAYHTIGAFVNYWMQRLDVKYVIFIMMNVAINFMMIRIFTFLS